MTRFLRFAWLLFVTTGFAFSAEVPVALTEALKEFRAEGTKGWSFTQTTTSGDKGLVERFSAEKPEFARWSMLKKDGREPTADETKSYEEKFTRRSRGDSAPNVKDQLDQPSCTIVSDDNEHGVYRFNLKPSDKEDKSAIYMTATFTLHKPSKTIERVELANREPFSPMFSVRIQEARTVMNYSLPNAERPTLLQEVVVKIRGRAMWIKSLDEDMTVTYSEYVGPQPKPGSTL